MTGTAVVCCQTPEVCGQFVQSVRDVTKNKAGGAHIVRAAELRRAPPIVFSGHMEDVYGEWVCVRAPCRNKRFTDVINESTMGGG